MNVSVLQLELCRQAIEELRSRFAADKEAVLLEASLLCRQKESAKAVQLLSGFKELRSDNTADDVLLALAQLQISEGTRRVFFDVKSN